MSKISNGNYITIQAFMINDLQLNGNELLVYAIIYGFSQNGECRFTGSLQYLADWTNTSKQCVLNNLKSLVAKGFIEKYEYYKNGIKFVEYYVINLNTIQKSLMGYSKKFNGIQKSLPNKIDNNINTNNITTNNNNITTNTNIINNNNNINNKLDNNIEEKEKIYKKEKVTPVDDILNNGFSNSDLINAFKDFIEMRKKIKKPMTERAVVLAIKSLKSLSNDEREQLEIINQSILHSWQGFYALKSSGTISNETNDYKDDHRLISEEEKKEMEEIDRRLNW